MSDELALNDERRVPRKGSFAWVRYEQKRFMELAAKHRGLTTPWFAAQTLGLSRQRIHQLMDSGHLLTHEVLGKRWIACDALEAFGALDRDNAFRYSGLEITA